MVYDIRGLQGLGSGLALGILARSSKMSINIYQSTQCPMIWASDKVPKSIILSVTDFTTISNL